ncbi:hypothetical protein [Mycoplasma sp. ATU-Cv-508]|uniref:glycoside hydrolase family 38 N-terminal domain-containing protein n=1 Tax=Mycoplasma sp. ATU-Cv-508 TaxID=2048001 RepID=UPI000FDDA0CE
MPKKPTVYFVRHTHWNREWYFTSDDSRTLLYYHLKYLIENLEKSTRDTFTFDGQSVIVDDFLRFAPDWRGRLKKVVKSRKLLIGPFYTQMDNYQARGEALVRNLEIGIDLAQQMATLWKSVTYPIFCHSQQTSQILRMNGIDSFFSRAELIPR